MFQAVVGVAAAADDCSLRVHNNGANAWIGRGQADALPRQIESLAKESFVNVVIGHSVRWGAQLCVLCRYPP
jgi:hypothetical protein